MSARGAALVLLSVTLALAPDVRAVVVGDGTPASCTEAALVAAVAGGGTITFACGTLPATIGLTAPLVIGADATIDGASTITLAGNDATSLVRVPAGRTLTLHGVKLLGGRGDGAGALENFGTTTLDACELFQSASTGTGGAVTNHGTLDVVSTIASGNTAPTAGGAIFSDAGTVTITDTQVAGNAATGPLGTGGGVHVAGGAVSIVRSLLEGNTAAQGGCLFVAAGASATVEATTLEASTAGTGGGIANAGTLVVADSEIEICRAGEQGGALWNAGTADLARTSIEDNEVAGRGGGIAHEAGTLSLRAVTIADNVAGTNGGAVYAAANAVLSNVTLSGNQAELRGGAVLQVAGESAVEFTTVVGNGAAVGGGLATAGGARFTLRAVALGDNVTDNCNGTFASGGSNVSSDVSCAALASAGDRHGIPLQLGPLGANGGATETHLPAAASPLVDGVADGMAPALDQRGVPRPQGRRADVGAVEACVGMPAAPAVREPADRAMLDTGTVTLVWEPSPCAESYAVVVRRRSPSGRLVARAVDVVASTYTTAPLRARRRYAWRVRACRAGRCAASAWTRFRVR